MIRLSASQMIILLTATMVLNACGGPAPVFGPSFEGRLLIHVVASPDEETPEGLYELTRNPASSEIDMKLLVPDLPDFRMTGGGDEWDIVISENKAYLLYTTPAVWPIAEPTRRGTWWRDLQTGEEKRLASEAECVSAAPDGGLVSYSITDQLYIYDIATDTAQSIFQSPSADYFGAGRITGHFSCGTWIAPDRLVFERRTGMPRTITLPGGARASVITLALIGKTITFVDTPKRDLPQVEVLDISSDGNHILMSCLEQEGSCFYPIQSFNDLNTPGQPIACGVDSPCGELIGFSPNSQEYIIERRIAGPPDFEYQLSFINIDTLEERAGPKVPTEWDDLTLLRNSQNYVAFTEKDPDVIGDVLKISDLSTGHETTVWEPGKRGLYWIIIAWLPE